MRRRDAQRSRCKNAVMVRRTSCLGAIALVSWASVGNAQPSDKPTDKPLAEALFQDGRELVEQGRIAEGCAKFAASQHVEPKLGTLLNLATCHETEGRTASAWAEFVEARAQAERNHQPERVAFAREHVEALEKRLSKIVIAVGPAPRLVVSLDGVPVASEAVGSPFPVDPGPHEIAVNAHGKRGFALRITVAEGPSEQRVAVPPLEDEMPPSTLDLEAPQKPPPRPVEERDRTPAIVALGIGAVAIGVGAYTGIRAFSLKADGQRECVGEACSQRGLDLFDDSRKNATVSTISFGVAIAAVAVGAWFFLKSEAK
jgi:hypothetical protein